LSLRAVQTAVVWQRCCAGCCAECCTDCSGEKQSIPIGHKRRTYTSGKVREMAPLGRSLLQLMALSWAPQGLPSENSQKGLHCTGAALETLNALPRWAAEGCGSILLVSPKLGIKHLGMCMGLIYETIWGMSTEEILEFTRWPAV
jgi:hypothetical protein